MAAKLGYPILSLFFKTILDIPTKVMSQGKGFKDIYIERSNLNFHWNMSCSYIPMKILVGLVNKFRIVGKC